MLFHSGKSNLKRRHNW